MRDTGKLLSRCLSLALLSVAVSVGLGNTGKANASLPMSQIELMPVPEPQLPPLGELSKYLPPEELYRDEWGTHLVIRLGDRRVYVYKNNQVTASYPIAVGKDGWETPTGEYQVMEMIREPAWQHPWTGEIVPPGPDNPLGARWIGFWTDGTNYIGFHGTPNENSVGNAASHGCIRMYNKDILLLFAQVDVGTPVKVEP